jgi:hypothetical protein
MDINQANQMKLLTCDEIADTILNLINTEKQFHVKTLFLTVKSIYKIQGRGSVDFGGSEYKEAERILISPIKKNQNDKYGWWELEKGTYFIEFNEKFGSPKQRLYIISPSKRILNNGTYHSLIVKVEKEFSPKTLLIVGENGIFIKENARISLCKVFEI